MGFGVNFNKPVIKETQAMHDGGAGNLGYFENENKKEEEKNKSIFEDGEDSFEKKDGEPDELNDFSIPKLIAEIILTIKDWFKKTFKLN